MDPEKAQAMLEAEHADAEKHKPALTNDEAVSAKMMLRKLDLTLLPLLSLAYLLAYMDRNNIGYARLMGFERNLKLTPQQYYNAVMLFYAGFLCAVFPGNFLIRKITPNLQLGFAVLFFGLCVCCMNAARGYADVVGLRFGVGFAEALLQSAALYMSYWYTRHELGKRIAIFYSAATLSGVFSGLLAYGVQKDLTIKGARPAWQWLFLIEGIIAIGLGLLIVAILPKFPDKMTTSWLFTQEQVNVAVKRSQESNKADSIFERWQILSSLKDPKTWFFSLTNATSALILASTGAFLPSIVKSFGFSAVNSQLFTVIPYACAFVSMILIGILSDHYKNKGYFILSSLSTSGIGLIVLLSTKTKTAGMAGACLLVTGAYPVAVMQIAWIQINFCGSTKRAMSWGMAMIFGQGFSMLGAQIYTTPPRYVKGHATLLGFVVMAMIMVVAAQAAMRRANRKREAELQQYHAIGQVHPDATKSFEETCDDHINFRYIL